MPDSPREDRETTFRRLAAILEAVADGVTVSDRDGRLSYVNAAAARVCGFDSADEMLHATPDEVRARFAIFDEAGAPFAPEALPGARVVVTGESESALMHVRSHRTGESWWAVVRASPLLGPDGRIDAVVNVWHDVTKDRRREEHARYISNATATLASSLDFRGTLASLAVLLVPGLSDWCSIHLLEGDSVVNVAIAHVDPAKQSLAREYELHYGPDPGSAGGVWNVIRTGRAELYAELTDELLVRSARSPEHLALLRGVGMRSVVIAPIRTRDRVVGTMSLVSGASGRRFDAEDVALAEELGRRAGSAIENAQLYTAERAVRRQLELIARAGEAFSATLDYEETLRKVVELALPVLGDVAFFDVVEGDKVRRVAAAHEDPELDTLIKAAPWQRSERVDKNLCALSSGQPGFHPSIDDAWRQDVATSPEHLAFLRRMQLCSMITVPLRSQREVLGSLTVCHGRSGRHHTEADLALAEELARRAGVAVLQARLYEASQTAAERAEEASRIKDEFLATVSHELRTPLNAILGWASILKQRPADPTVAKAVEVIHRNAQAQGRIIEDILDVARIITGKVRLDARPMDLGAVVQNALEVIMPSAEAKRIDVEVRRGASAFLVADPDRLQQVVWNLLSNAVKFTDTGGRIVVTIEEGESDVVLTVTDSGRGIAEAFLPFVFDRFKQADSSTTRHVGGLGLGLAIVRHIVELHGGSVRAESAGEGRGATFRVTLPIRAVASAVQTRRETPSTELLKPPRPHVDAALLGLRVVVVDDEADARELLSTILSHAGADVTVASSAAAAIAHVRAVMPHVLVSDIGMPGEDGYALIRKVRAMPGMGTLPSVALTAYTRAEDRMKALEAGFTAHVKKPVDPEQLVSILSSLARLADVG